MEKVTFEEMELEVVEFEETDVIATSTQDEYTDGGAL